MASSFFIFTGLCEVGMAGDPGDPEVVVPTLFHFWLGFRATGRRVSLEPARLIAIEDTRGRVDNRLAIPRQCR